MSGGFGAVAVAAIDATQGQEKTAFSDAVRATQQMQGAQSFELSMDRMSQASPDGAASCQQAELNCKKQRPPEVLQRKFLKFWLIARIQEAISHKA